MDNTHKIVYQLMAEDKYLRSTIKSLSTFMKTNSPKMSITFDPKSVSSLQAMNSGLKQTSKEATIAQHKMKSLGASTALAAARFAAFSIAATPLYLISRALSSGAKEAINFDKQMVRVGQTLGISHRNITGLNKQITDLSTRWGISSSKLAEISVTLAQTGMSARDTQIALKALAKTELTPSFNDIINTTEGVIAIMNQFKMSAKDLEGILSDINVVAKAFPVEAEDIMTAMRKAGGVFQTTGGNARELIALFTAVRSTTRESADTIATGFRTIFARLERTRTQNILARLGIDIRNVKNGYEAIRILANETQRLMAMGSAGQSSLAIIREELGGIRQIAKVIPMLTQFSKAEQAMAMMQKDKNSLDRDAIQSQEALSRQIDKVKESFLSLSRTFMDDPSIKFFIGQTLQLTTNLLKMADSLKGIIPYLLMFSIIKFGPKFGRFGADLMTESRAKFGGGIPRVPLNTGGTPAGKIGTLLTPGELVVAPPEVDTIGIHNLERLNRGVVPGYGNRDSVAVDLDPGSFVLNKRVSGRIMANKGGLIGLANGGEVFSDRFFAEKRRKEEEEMWRQREKQLKIEEEQRKKREQRASRKITLDPSTSSRGYIRSQNIQPKRVGSMGYVPRSISPPVKVISGKQYAGPLGVESRADPSIGLSTRPYVSPLVSQSRATIEAQRNAKSQSNLGISPLVRTSKSKVEGRYGYSTDISPESFESPQADRAFKLQQRMQEYDENQTDEGKIKSRIQKERREREKFSSEAFRNVKKSKWLAPNQSAEGDELDNLVAGMMGRSGPMRSQSRTAPGDMPLLLSSEQKQADRAARRAREKNARNLEVATKLGTEPPKTINPENVQRAVAQDLAAKSTLESGVVPTIDRTSMKGDYLKQYLNEVNATTNESKKTKKAQQKLTESLNKASTQVDKNIGGGGGGRGGNKPPTWGQRAGAMARNPMTWMVMGSMMPQAAEGLMSDKYKGTPQGKGLSAAIGAGVTTAATVAMINPVAGAIVGLGVGIKTFVDTVKEEEERLHNVNYSKSLDNMSNLLDNEAKLRQTNNKKFESDLKKAVSQRGIQEQVQYNDIFSARGQESSKKIFEHKEATAEFGIRAQQKVYEGKNLTDIEYRDLAKSNMTQKQLDNLWVTARSEAEAAVPKIKTQVSGGPMSPATMEAESRDVAGERKYAGEYVKKMLTKFGKEKYAPGVAESGEKERAMFEGFNKANDALNFFTSTLNGTADALAFARESASKFDNSLSMITGGKIQASTQNLNILQNPKLVGSNAYKNAVGSASGGILGGRATNVLDIGRKISATLPSILEKNVGSNVDMKKIENELTQSVGNIPDAFMMINQALQSVYDELETNQGVLKQSSIGDVTSKAVENTQKATNEALVRIEEERVKIEQKIIDDLTSINQMRQKTTQAELSAGELGYGISSSRQQRAFEQGTSSTGVMSRIEALNQVGQQQSTILQGTGFRGNVFDPKLIGAEISKIRADTTQDPRAMVANQDKLSRLEQALDNLRNSNIMLEQTQGKLAEAMNKQQQGRSLAEKYLTGSRREQRNIEKSIGYAEQLRSRSQAGLPVGAAEFNQIPRNRRGDTMGIMSEMDSIYGPVRNEILDDAMSRLPHGIGVGIKGEVRGAEANLRGVEDKQKEAVAEQVKAQKEAERKYQEVILASHIQISQAFENASKNMLLASENMKSTVIQHEIKPVTVMLMGDTILQNLGPMMQDLINKAIANGVRTADPALSPAMNNARL